MARMPYFYPLVTVVGLGPWIGGGLLYGKTGLIAGLVTSFIGIMVLNDANRRHAQEQRRRVRRELRRGR